MILKLPGFIVDKDGSITLQNQKIDKILVDGKELFLNDNFKVVEFLSADMVAEIEMFDTQTERAETYWD